MKSITLLVITMLLASSYSFAEGPRTVGTYKRHMKSEEHRSDDFDHTLHHMLFLSGVTDGYAVINDQRAANQEELLYCQPEAKTLNGADYIQILEKKLYHAKTPAPDDLTVAEAMLSALQKEFPCQ